MSQKLEVDLLAVTLLFDRKAYMVQFLFMYCD